MRRKLDTLERVGLSRSDVFEVNQAVNIDDPSQLTLTASWTAAGTPLVGTVRPPGVPAPPTAPAPTQPHQPAQAPVTVIDLDGDDLALPPVDETMASDSEGERGAVVGGSSSTADDEPGIAASSKRRRFV